MDSLLTPALYMEDDGKDIKPDQIPSNGSEYLRKVIAERERCLETMSVRIDRNKFKNKQNVFLKEPPNIKSAPISLRPTLEWQTFQVADFSEMRMRTAKQYENNKSIQEPMKILPQLPNWESSEDKEWKDYFCDNQPKLSIVLRMNQAALERCLEVLVSWLDDIEHGGTIPENIGQWLYAVLVCLRLPLIGDVVSTLRDLARKCAELRSHLKPDEVESIELAAPLNLFICLVSRYFRQIDLVD